VTPEAEPEQTAYPLTLTVTPRADFELKVAGRGAQADADVLRRVLDGLTLLLAALAEPADPSVRELAARLPAAWRGSARAPEAPRPRPAVSGTPAGETERVVAEVWQELFGLEQIGVEENFFDLGGQSIMLVQAHERLRERLGIELPVVALLQFPTIRSLARHLSGETDGAAGVGASQDRAAKQRQALARQRQRIRRP
jgi:acyl carrier protein